MNIKYIIILTFTIFLIGCNSTYIIPDSECPITSYLIEGVDREWDSISVTGKLITTGDYFDDPDLSGYEIYKNDFHYGLIESWNDPTEEPSLTKEDKAKLDNLLGKKITLSGKGYTSEEFGFSRFVITSCN
tara:strand:+ start:88 stop:480 length:393 start_codon:yes stop_codon:yes gene_type:complete